MNSKMYSCSNEEFIELVKQSNTAEEVKKALGYTNCGGNTNRLFKKRCKELKIDTSHFDPIKSRGHIKRSFDNVFCKNSTADQETLRRWYLKGEYSDYKCSICRINTWNNKFLTLRLDHINGVNNDNRLENLRWLCPNCDSQSEFYCGRNTKSRKNTNVCIDCGKPVENHAARCIECYKKQSKTAKILDSITREDFKKEIREKSFQSIADRFSVARGTLRAVCREFNLPDTKEKIDSYSEEEWKNI